MKNLFLVFTAVLFITSSSSFAQIDLLEKIKDKIEQKADEKTNEQIDEALNEAEEGIKNNKTNKNEDEVETNNNKETVKPKTSDEKIKAYSKYDFIPGEKVTYYDDFSSTSVGDFPANWNTSVSGEVVTLNKFPGKWFKLDNYSSYEPLNIKLLPENYTLEFDFIANSPDEEAFGALFVGFFSKSDEYRIEDNVIGNAGCEFKLQYNFIEAYNWKEQQWGNVETSKSSEIVQQNLGKKIKVSIWVQKERARLYVNESKIFDLPKMVIKGYQYDGIRFTSILEENKEVYISNIRLAEGATDTRNKLLTEGKWVTRGILFDSGSDVIKEESYGSLKEIAAVLNGSPDVLVKIIGHTDSDGSDDANLDLSKRRASSVKKMLSEIFNVNLKRMETDGRGESEPSDDNNTAEGKANNRRVEFIKL